VIYTFTEEDYMKIRLFLALIVATILLGSAVATAQTSSNSATSLLICGMSKDAIQKSYGEYDEKNLADKLTEWVNAGKFDDTSSEKATIKATTDAKRDPGNGKYDSANENMTDPKRMCLLALLTSMADFSDAGKRTAFLTAVHSKYAIGTATSKQWKAFDKVLGKSNPVANETDQAKATRVRAKASEVITAFFDKTTRIRTTLLNETVSEYNGMTDAAARQAVIDLLLQQVTTNTITQIQTVTIQIGVLPADKSKEVLALLDKKIENIKKVKANDVNCETLKAAFNVIWGGSVVVTDPEDGSIDKNITAFTAGKFSVGSYLLSTTSGDVIATDEAAAKTKIEELKKLYDKLKCKKVSSVDYGDIDGIAELSNGWFTNWAECNDVNIPVDNSSTMVAICRQKILEADYTEDQARMWGLTEKDNTLTNNVTPGTLIDQLGIFIGASVTVKNKSKENVQKIIDLNATCSEENNKNGKNTTECAIQWEEQGKYSSKVTEAERCIKHMNKELLEGFSTETVKNICFGFNVKSANSPIAKALSADVSDLSATLSAEKTLELYTIKQTNRTSTLKVKSIQEACVFFNRIKKAQISGSEKDFAQKLVTLFGIDADKKTYITGEHGVDAEVVLVTQLADALVNQNDDMIIHWLSFLKGVNIFDVYYYGERQARLDDGVIVNNKMDKTSLKFMYSKYDIVRDLIIEHSAAGSASSTNDRTAKDNTNKDNTNKDNTSNDNTNKDKNKKNTLDIKKIVGKVDLSKTPSLNSTNTNSNTKGKKEFTNRGELYKDLKDNATDKATWESLAALIKSYLNGTDADFQKIIDMISKTEELKNKDRIKKTIVEQISLLTGLTSADLEKIKALMDAITINETELTADLSAFDELIKTYTDASGKLVADKFVKDSEGLNKLIRGRVLYLELINEGGKGRVPVLMGKDEVNIYKKLITK
jgi:hypothetical protein